MGNSNAVGFIKAGNVNLPLHLYSSTPFCLCLSYSWFKSSISMGPLCSRDRRDDHSVQHHMLPKLLYYQGVKNRTWNILFLVCLRIVFQSCPLMRSSVKGSFFPPTSNSFPCLLTQYPHLLEMSSLQCSSNLVPLKTLKQR